MIIILSKVLIKYEANNCDCICPIGCGHMLGIDYIGGFRIRVNLRKANLNETEIGSITVSQTSRNI